MDAKFYFKAILLFIPCSLVFYWMTLYDDPTKYSPTAEPEAIQPGAAHFWALHDFSYILTPRNKCQILVTSYSGEVMARSALRRAYPIDELLRLGIWRVFLLAKPKRGVVDASQSSLVDENRRFGDLLQGDFDESYRNLTYKHAMGLKWASTSCPSAQYVMKMDDDIAVDLYRVTETIVGYGSNTTFDLMGYVFDKLRPIRLKANKWYVTTHEYNREVYPKFVSGWFYVTKPEVAKLLVENALSLPYFWIDDVFLTGIAAELINARFLDVGRLFSTYPEVLDCCVSKNVVCEYLVAPSSGDFDLQIRFQRHSHNCKYSGSCSSLAPDLNISQICVAKKVLPKLHRGFPSFAQIQLR
ncbi:unnamed protein product [Nesidiocoris tenuis]|uniref:Hexosyltransferase n=1 Tax=Nesidiocoris tenuis TaxID=355587 RepID=A0A6H5H290_9HEMI|nr:unnamed protein product [Nesidiocoris tenuis]